MAASATEIKQKILKRIWLEECLSNILREAVYYRTYRSELSRPGIVLWHDNENETRAKLC